MSVWLCYSIKSYIRFLPFLWQLKYSWELRMHYIFYLFDGVFKFVPHSFLKGNIEKKRYSKKECHSLISLPLLKIILPISAFSTLCLLHNYPIVPPTTSFSLKMNMETFSLQLHQKFYVKSVTTVL